MLTRIDSVQLAADKNGFDLTPDVVMQELTCTENDIKFAGGSFREFLLQMDASGHKIPEAAQLIGEALQNKSLATVVNTTRFTAETLIKGILHAAKLRMEDLALLSSQFRSRIQRITSNDAQHEWLESNLVDNYLRLLLDDDQEYLGVRPVSYDDVHKRELYSFSNRTEPSQLASTKIPRFEADNNVELLRGKTIVTLGPGAGADEEVFLQRGANVLTADISPTIQDRLSHKFRDRIAETVPDEVNTDDPKIYIERMHSDMRAFLQKLIDDGISVDMIYSLSTLHFFDMTETNELFTLINKALKPGGHFISGLKAPRTTLDGEGICLVNVEGQKQVTITNEQGQPTTDKNGSACVVNRGFLGPDGISRFYRDTDIQRNMIEQAGIRIQRFVEDTVENYARPGEEQAFYFAFCKKPCNSSKLSVAT